MNVSEFKNWKRRKFSLIDSLKICPTFSDTLLPRWNLILFPSVMQAVINDSVFGCSVVVFLRLHFLFLMIYIFRCIGLHVCLCESIKSSGAGVTES